MEKIQRAAKSTNVKKDEAYKWLKVSKHQLIARNKIGTDKYSILVKFGTEDVIWVPQLNIILEDKVFTASVKIFENRDYVDSDGNTLRGSAIIDTYGNKKIY